MSVDHSFTQVAHFLVSCLQLVADFVYHFISEESYLMRRDYEVTFFSQEMCGAYRLLDITPTAVTFHDNFIATSRQNDLHS